MTCRLSKQMSRFWNIDEPVKIWRVEKRFTHSFSFLSDCRKTNNSIGSTHQSTRTNVNWLVIFSFNQLELQRRRNEIFFPFIFLFDEDNSFHSFPVLLLFPDDLSELLHPCGQTIDNELWKPFVVSTTTPMETRENDWENLLDWHLFGSRRVKS